MRKTVTRKLPVCYVFLLSFLLQAGTGAAQWVQKANGRVSRSEVTSVVYNGKLFTFLGFRDGNLNVESSSEVYDPVANTWTLLSSIPAGKAMTHQGVALVDNTVWHIGGRVGKNPGPLTSEIWIYNLSTNTWSAGPQLLDPATGKPVLWGGGGAALLGRTLHVFGGFVRNACNNDQSTYHFTLDVDQWLASRSQPAPWKNERSPMPVKRNHFSTVVLAGKIYALGGQFGHDCGGGDDKPFAHVYNPQTNAWTELPAMATPRSHAEGSSFAADGKIYIVAGQATNGTNTNRVTIFNPAANNGKGAWYDDTNLTLPKSYEGLSSKMIGNSFIFSHGGEGASTKVRRTTYSRTLTRTPVYQFGFLPACATLSLKAGSRATAKTLLFTIDGSKSYTLSANASWLTPTKNKTGMAIQNGVDVEAAITTTGLTPGSYTGVITVTGTTGGVSYTAAQYCIKLTVTASDRLEAEDAVLYRVQKDAAHGGFTGSGFADYVNATGDYIEWTANRPAAGDVVLQFRYANGATADRPLRVEINGVALPTNLSFPSTGNWSAWSTVSVKAKLNSGSNKIRLTAIGYSGANLDHMAVLVPQLLEAEDAVLYRVQKDAAHGGFTGSGFADYVNATSDFVEWSVTVQDAGPVTLQFRYANGSTVNRPLKVEVNGTALNTGLAFPPTGSWTAWSTVSLAANLSAGPNKIRLTATTASGANLDHLMIWPAAAQTPNAAPLMVQAATMAEAPGTGLAVNVAPNPAHGQVRLRWNRLSDAPVEIRVIDALGHLRRSFVVKNSNGQLDLMVDDLADGLYVVYARQGKEQASTKLLVKKNR